MSPTVPHAGPVGPVEPVAPATSEPRIRVERAGADHAAAMADFFRDVGWSADATPDSVLHGRADDARENPGAFGAEPPTFLVLTEDRILGYVSSIPTRVWCDGVELRAHWIKGLMVRPEHRNGPLGFLVLKEAARHLPRAIATVVHPAARRLFVALGFEDLGALSNHIRLLRPARVLARIDADALGFGGMRRGVASGLRAAQRLHMARVIGGATFVTQTAWIAGAARRLRRDERIVSSLELPGRAELDELWAAARPVHGAACVRDGAHLAWRYVRRADAPYRFVAAYVDGSLAGLAVLRPPRLEGDGRLRGIRIATISELVYRPDDSGTALALLEEAERVAAALDADAMLCSTSTPEVRRQLARRAYVPVPGNLHFLVRDRLDPSTLPRHLERWWLTRGDGESDGTF